MKNLAYFTLESYFRVALQDPGLKGKKYNQIIESYNEAYEVIKFLNPEKFGDVNSVDTKEMRIVIDCLFLVFKYNFPQSLTTLYLSNMQILVSANFFGDGTFQSMCPINDKLVDVKELLVRIPDKYLLRSMANINVYLDVIKYIQALMVNEPLKVHDREFLTLFSNMFTILIHYATKQHANEGITNATIIQIIGFVFQKIEGKKYKFKGISKSQSIVSTDHHQCYDNTDINKDNTSSNENNDLDVEQEQRNIFIHSNDKFELVNMSPKFEKQLSAYEEEFSTHKTIYKKGKNNQPTPNINESKIKSTDEASSIDITDDTTCVMDKENLVFDDVYIKDAYNLLILISRTVLQYYNDVSKPQFNNFQSYRMLMASLSIIKHIINMCGPKCCNHNMFVQYIKEEVYLLLMKIISLSNVSVFIICLSTFTNIIIKFRKYLKNQIEIYFNNVLISLIRSNTTLSTKILIMESLKNLLKDMDIICYLYVNYDCNKRCNNIFEILVDSLCKQAKQIDADVKPKEAHIECCTMALECLVVIFWQLSLSAHKHWTNNRHMIPDNNNIDVTDKSPLPNEPNCYDGRVPQSLLVAKEKKSIMDNGIDIFNEHPIRGLRFLKSSGIIGQNPIDVAKFLLETNKLSRVQIGNYLGEPDDESLHVMYAYVELFDFQDKDFLDSLRMLLSNFWLPGEAQKIDRIMEKFAGYYFLQNPNQTIFASADVAYILAYSVIMLTTDLHNPHIKHKMTLEQYRGMNSKINDGENLQTEFLTSIYNSIKENPINLKATFEKNKVIECKMTTISETTIKQLEESINKSEHSDSIVDIPHDTLVGTIFQCIWKQCLVSFSVIINNITDVNLLYIPFSGLRIAIRVSALLNEKLALDTFLKSLINFTNLLTGSIITDMKDKNIDAIRALLTVANEDGNFITDNWTDILSLISNLELVQNMANSNNFVMPNNDFPKNNKLLKRNSTHGPSIHSLKLISSNINNIESNDKNLYVSDIILETVSQSILISVDKIFSNTKNLDDESIVVFVKNLCQVSINEINEKPNSRTFMLNKIVEIAHYNMDRIRISWGKIWRVLRHYFNIVGCITNEDIASFCIVSLRQLAFKFIDKEELDNFHFQKEFLKPFEDIFAKNESRTIKELILKSIDQIIKVQFNKIRSGWTSIHNVLAQAAQEPDIDIVRRAFMITCDIVNEVNNLHYITIRDTTICTLVVFATPINPSQKQFKSQIENTNQSVDGSANELVNMSNDYSFVDDNEPTQLDKIKLVFASASCFEPQTTPIVSAFKNNSQRSSILCASFSRNHSIDNPSTLLKQYSSDIDNYVSSTVDNLAVTDSSDTILNRSNEVFFSQREKIAHEVFVILKVYVDKVLANISDFQNPPEHNKNPWVTSWVVLFNRMAFLVQNGHGNISNLALKTFNSLLNDYGYMFTCDLWQDLINIYLNIFTICKRSDKTMTNKQKLEWLNKISQCAFEGLTGIIITYISVFNTETIVVFFDFLYYWARDIELETLSISTFNCVRILLKELLGTIDIHVYIKIFSSFMNIMDLIFPHVFVPYSSLYISESCFDYCRNTQIDIKQLLCLDDYNKYPDALYCEDDVNSTIDKYKTTRIPSSPIKTSTSEIYQLDYACYTHANLISNNKSIINEKLSPKNADISLIYNEFNKCQIQVEYMLSLTSLLSFIDDVDYNIKKELFDNIDVSVIQKWFIQLHSTYSCLKMFDYNLPLRKLIFSKILSISSILNDSLGNYQTSIPSVVTQQSTVAGCLLKYAQVVFLPNSIKQTSDHDIITIDYITDIYREIIVDFCNNQSNNDLWNSALSIALSHMIFFSTNNIPLFNRMILFLYNHLCSLISSNLDENNKNLLRQLFMVFSKPINELFRNGISD